MTEPTQAQIEAAKEIDEYVRKTIAPWTDWRGHGPYILGIIQSHITAAAQVGEHWTDRQDWKKLYEFMCGLHTNLHFEIDRLKVEINRLTAAQVGEQDWQRGYEAGMKSAAPAIAVLQTDVAAAIKRCVQVVERYAINIGEMAFIISAELRNLQTGTGGKPD